MAWIAVALDGTLLSHGPESMEGEPPMPVDGAVEAMQLLASEGHRLTAVTSRFAAMPDSERHRLKMEFEQELLNFGFPPIEVWTGTTQPSADVFIGGNFVTFDQDWGLALAQTQQMLQDSGLLPDAPMMDQQMAEEGPPDET